MMDGTTVNVDVTAPGAIIALALMFLKVMFNADIYTFHKSVSACILFNVWNITCLQMTNPIYSPFPIFMTE